MELEQKLCQQLDQLLPYLGSSLLDRRELLLERSLAPNLQLLWGAQHSQQTVKVTAPKLAMVLEGYKTSTLNNQSIHFDRGQVFLLVPGVKFEFMHHPSPQGLYRALILDFSSEVLERFRRLYLAQLKGTRGQDNIAIQDNAARPNNAETTVALDLAVDLFPSLGEAILHLVKQAMAQAESLSVDLHWHHVMEVLLLLLQSNQHQRLRQMLYPSFVTQARYIVRANLSSDWSLERLAQAMDVSIATLKRRLSAEQLSYRQLLDEERMGRAMELLQQSDQSIAQIALACGYSSPSRFASRFFKYYQLKPSEVRSQ